MSMLQDLLTVAIYMGGNEGVSVGGAIFVDNKASSDEPYHFNIFIL